MVNIKYLLNAESFAVLLFYLIELNNALAVLELEQNEVLRANSQIEALELDVEKEKNLAMRVRDLVYHKFVFSIPEKRSHIIVVFKQLWNWLPIELEIWRRNWIRWHSLAAAAP